MEALIPHLTKPPLLDREPRRILEPAAGDGNIVRVLQRAFPQAEIVTGDILTGQDFTSYDYEGLFDLAGCRRKDCE